MRWNKHEWEDGENITSTKLNHIEYGINRAEESDASSVALIVHEIPISIDRYNDWDVVEISVNSRLDKDFETIKTAFERGIPVILETYDHKYFIPVANIYYEYRSDELDDSDYDEYNYYTYIKDVFFKRYESISNSYNSSFSLDFEQEWEKYYDADLGRVVEYLSSDYLEANYWYAEGIARNNGDGDL